MSRLFKIVYAAGVIGEIILRMPYERQRRQIPRVDQRAMPGERGLFAGLSAGMLGLPLIYSLTTWLNFANYRWSARARDRAGGLGCAVLGAAVWLFWRSHRDLGANWSPTLEVSAHHRLVTAGVYRRIRHPMYAAHFLWCIAQALLLPNWIAGWGSLAAFLPLYRRRVPREERMMADYFGDDYRAYCARTGRILPRLRARG
jgi:protein-S-isoprenylcysteine O-methyltransferase Ste14